MTEHTGEQEAQRRQDAASLRTVAAELVRRDLVNMAGILHRVADRLDHVSPPG